MRRLGLALFLVLTTLAPRAGRAQFRPPPPSEAQLLIRDAETERAEAAQKEAKGDRAAAIKQYTKAADLYEKALKVDAKSDDAPAAAAGFGASCVAARDYERAVKVLQPFHAARPDTPAVAFPLALAQFKLNRFAEAVPLLEGLAKGNAPEHFMVHYYLGSHGLLTQDGGKVVGALTEYLKRRPVELAVGDAQIEELIGRGWLLQKKAGDAKAAFARSLKLRPSIAAQLGIAAALELEGRGAEALQLVEGLQKRDEKNPELLERLARMYVARNQLGRATALATSLMQISRSAPAAQLLGDIHGAQGDWAKAELAYRQAVALAPRSVPPLLALGRALSRLGKHDEVVKALEGVAAEGDPQLLAVVGSAQRRGGHFQKAVEIHGRLAQARPRAVESHLLLGADHFATGQWDEAIRDYTTALEIDPASAAAKRWLAQALWRRAATRTATDPKSDAALLDLRRAYDLEATEPLAQALGAAQLAQEKFADAERTLAARASDPKAPWQTQLVYAYALLGGDKAKEALPIFDRLAGAALSGELQAKVELGWALSKVALGEPEAAAKRLASSKASSPALQANLTMIAVRLAWKHLEAGDEAAAARELQIVGAGNKSPPVELVRALLAVENKNFAAALAGIKSALAEKQAWFEPATRPVLEAYVSYRMGKLVEARKQIAALAKLGAPAKLPFVGKLTRAIDEREAEQLFAQNSAAGLAKIEKLLKPTAGDDPNDPRHASNLAAARYRRGQQAAAVAVWKTLAAKLPEAELNLGLHALQQERNPKEALVHLRRYAASGGARSSGLRESIDRLAALYDEEAKP